MKKITFLLLIFVLTFTFSCDPDDDTPKTTYKLVKIESFNPNNELNYTVTIEYNDDGFISKAHKVSSNETNTTSYIYTNGKITSFDYSDGSSTNCIYTGTLITSTLGINTNGEETGDGTTYTYNSSEQVIIQHEFSPGGFDVTTISTYDDNDNIISRGSSTYTYDSKKNPFRLVFHEVLQKMQSIGQNNLLSVDQEYTYTYEYNNNDYPTKSSNLFNGELQEYTLYTYEEI